MVSHCFVSVGDMGNNTDPRQNENQTTFSDVGIVYKLDENNMIGQKFSEYFTSLLAKELVEFGGNHIDKN